jgi:hypothetical protein
MLPNVAICLGQVQNEVQKCGKNFIHLMIRIVWKQPTCSEASCASSKMATKTIAPDAKPRPIGRSGANISTNQKARTAIKGWGMLDMIACMGHGVPIAPWETQINWRQEKTMIPKGDEARSKAANTQRTHKAPRVKERPRGIRTKHTATPSGMLCNASDPDTKRPSARR